MTVELAGRRGGAVERSAPTVATVAALGVLIDALSDPQVSHRWLLLVTALLLGLGLVAGRVGERIGRPSAASVRTVATGTALVILFGALSTGSWWSPTWPETVTAALLGVGLMAGPVLRLLRERSLQRLVGLVASVVALAAIFAARADGDHPQWPLWVAAVLLGLGLAAGPVVQRLTGRSVHGSAQTASMVGALSGLAVSLTSLPYGAPASAEKVPVVILGAGLLAAAALGRLGGAPRERVLSARVDELSRTRRGALDVQATELRRIERDLHDGAQARLVALSMKLGRAEDRYADHPEVSALLREARQDAAAAIRELRELARGIAPPVLTDRGLEAAVRSLAQRSGAAVTVSGDLERRPLPAVETAAYFVVAESLTNAAKHAPGARVEVRLDERGGDLFIEVTDFGPGEADPAPAGATRSSPCSSSPSTSSPRTRPLLRKGEAGIGYLLKERVSEVRTFVEAVQRVAAGGTALDREVVSTLVGERSGVSGARADAIDQLTARERETLELVAQGRSNAAIARELVVTLGAVEKHISNIFAKLGLPATDDDHRRVLAVLTFLRATAG